MLEYSGTGSSGKDFAELGHDVYYGNNRGVEYSLGHTEMASPAEDPAKYWDFSWEEMGIDVVANSKAMNADAGTGKGWYIGYS